MRIGRLVLGGVCVTAMTGCFLPKAPTTTDLYLQGELQAERGDLDTAMASLSKAIEKNPQMGLAYVARGKLFKDKGDYQKAAGDFEKASSLEPYNFSAHYELGLMYQYLLRFSEAITAYQRAVEIRPLDPNANMNMAMVYLQMGQPLRGLPYAQRALQGGGSDSDTANAYANLGTIDATLGNDDAAIEAFKHSLELSSRQPEVYLNLGQEYIKLSKFEQARGVLENARQIVVSPAISERLGLVYYKLHDLEKARAAFQDALRQTPNYTQALNGLGVVAMTRSLAMTPPDVDAAREALEYWNKSLKIDPNQAAIQQLVNKYSRGK
jgi:tetratricopeptide (TPR) repeat protein